MCSCGSPLSYTLYLHGYEDPTVTGNKVAVGLKAPDGQWQTLQVSALANSRMKGVTVMETGNGQRLVVDLLELSWSGE